MRDGVPDLRVALSELPPYTVVLATNAASPPTPTARAAYTARVATFTRVQRAIDPEVGVAVRPSVIRLLAGGFPLRARNDAE